MPVVFVPGEFVVGVQCDDGDESLVNEPVDQRFDMDPGLRWEGPGRWISAVIAQGASRDSELSGDGPDPELGQVACS